MNILYLDCCRTDEKAANIKGMIDKLRDTSWIWSIKKKLVQMYRVRGNSVC